MPAFNVTKQTTLRGLESHRADVCSGGSPGFIVNTNALQAQAPATSPYEVLAGTATNHGNVVLTMIPNAHYFYVSLWWALTHTTTINYPYQEDCVIRVYGRVPLEDGEKPLRYPHSVNSLFLNVLTLNHQLGGFDSEGIEKFKGIWVPLTDEGHTNGTTTHTLKGPSAVYSTENNLSNYNADGQSDEIRVNTAGCDAVMVCVDTVASFTATAGTLQAAALVGRTASY